MLSLRNLHRAVGEEEVRPALEGLPNPSGDRLIPMAGSRQPVGSPQGLKPPATSPAIRVFEVPSFTSRCDRGVSPPSKWAFPA